MKPKTPVRIIPTVPVEEWEKIVEESIICNEILESDRFNFFRQYLKNAQDSILKLIANNSIKDTVETITNAETNTSITIKTTKEEQLNELSGQYKFIDKIFEDLKTFAKQRDEYIKLQEKKKLIIEVSKEKNDGEAI